ncbi:MAG: hypothetical protein M1826_001033 [Phylliscum demangeonii]|nr:MAG: hypothetical protein M1826_001033 [Phylliscum demangeonii]
MSSNASLTSPAADPNLEMVKNMVRYYFEVAQDERRVANAIRELSSLLHSYSRRRQLSLDDDLDLNVITTAKTATGKRRAAHQPSAEKSNKRQMLEKWRSHPNLRLSRHVLQAVEPWAALFQAIRRTAPARGAAMNQCIPLARADKHTAFFVACAGVPGLNHLRRMMKTGRATGNIFRGSSVQDATLRRTLAPKARVCVSARALLSAGVQTDVDRIERRVGLAAFAGDYAAYEAALTDDEDDELYAIVPAGVPGVGRGKRAWRGFVLSVHPTIDPALITTKTVGADASPAAIAAHSATRRLHNLLTEGRALLELVDEFGEGILVLYPPQATQDAICYIPKATRAAAIKSLAEQLPGLLRLCKKVWQVYTRFCKNPITSPRI